MSRQFIDSRNNAHGVAADPAARRAEAVRPAAERGRHFRIDELWREIVRRGHLSSPTAPLAWGFGGFLIGAIFWHFIGFWGFLSVVVLKGPEAAAVTVVSRPAIAAPAVVPNCTLLVLNRSTGQTTAVPCPDFMPAFDEASNRRQDFALASAR